MSSTKFNLKNPGVKRVMQEAKELAKENNYEYDAHPLEDNIFEWHFTVRGPKDTEFEDGRYHGRILLPSEYPFKPPEIIFLTPNGRFELNTKICLSITGFHPEFWQPAWGIRTVLLAVIGFFPTEAKGAIGGLDYTKEERKRLAKKSMGWICPTCKVNTSDALSDTPPEVEKNNKEVLPDFVISYNVEQKDAPIEKSASENDRGSSSSSSNGSSNSSSSSGHSGNNDNLSDHQVGSIQDPIIQNIHFVPERPSTVEANRRRHPPPIWLDALIAGLTSFVIVLIVRRYIL
ncbi:ubiquitin-conjugating enzyme/RWD-like protein [Blakeslea trispora]|nr:ubiquitin-conjugating enzyme/RWD-like protein [Blakeslea trispora]